MIIHTATHSVTKISFFEGTSFNIKYPNIYTKTRYRRLRRLVSTTHSVEYIVRANNIETITIEFVHIKSFVYFTVINLICENSFFANISITDIDTTSSDSVK